MTDYAWKDKQHGLTTQEIQTDERGTRNLGRPLGGLRNRLGGGERS